MTVLRSPLLTYLTNQPKCGHEEFIHVLINILNFLMYKKSIGKYWLFSQPWRGSKERDRGLCGMFSFILHHIYYAMCIDIHCLLSIMYINTLCTLISKFDQKKITLFTISRISVQFCWNSEALSARCKSKILSNFKKLLPLCWRVATFPCYHNSIPEFFFLLRSNVKYMTVWNILVFKISPQEINFVNFYLQCSLLKECHLVS